MASRKKSSQKQGTTEAVPRGHRKSANDLRRLARPADSELGPLDHLLNETERREILKALRQAGGERTQAANMLGITRSRLYRRMEALGIDPKKIGAERSV